MYDITYFESGIPKPSYFIRSMLIKKSQNTLFSLRPRQAFSILDSMNKISKKTA